MANQYNDLGLGRPQEGKVASTGDLFLDPTTFPIPPNPPTSPGPVPVDPVPRPYSLPIPRSNPAGPLRPTSLPVGGLTPIFNPLPGETETPGLEGRPRPPVQNSFDPKTGHIIVSAQFLAELARQKKAKGSGGVGINYDSAGREIGRSLVPGQEYDNSIDWLKKQLTNMGVQSHELDYYVKLLLNAQLEAGNEYWSTDAAARPTRIGSPTSSKNPRGSSSRPEDDQNNPLARVSKLSQLLSSLGVASSGSATQYPQVGAYPQADLAQGSEPEPIDSLQDLYNEWASSAAGGQGSGEFEKYYKRLFGVSMSPEQLTKLGLRPSGVVQSTQYPTDASMPWL